MYAARGKRGAQLPFAVVDLAVEMFAGSSGFSGPEIHRFFAQYNESIPDYAWGGGSPSRKDLFRMFLRRFPLQQQMRILHDLIHYQGPMKHGAPSRELKENLLTMLQGIDAPAFQDVRDTAERLDWQRVIQEWQRARDQVHRDPAGAITAARSMLESVCKHVLRELDPTFDGEGELPRVYRRALELVDTPTGSGKAVRQIIKGCMSIVQGVAELRNKLGDAHGRAPGDPIPSPQLALLAVNAAGTAALYLLQSFEA